MCFEATSLHHLVIDTSLLFSPSVFDRITRCFGIHEHYIVNKKVADLGTILCIYHALRASDIQSHVP